jgi:hypothetical protein
MTKIKDRPSKKETRKAGKNYPVEPFIRASYIHAFKFYQERHYIEPEDLKRELLLDLQGRDAEAEDVPEIRIIAQRVNDRLIFVLQDRYGYSKAQVLEGLLNVAKELEKGPLVARAR